MQSVISKLTSDPPSEEDRHLVGEGNVEGEQRTGLDIPFSLSLCV